MVLLRFLRQDMKTDCGENFIISVCDAMPFRRFARFYRQSEKIPFDSLAHKTEQIADKMSEMYQDISFCFCLSQTSFYISTLIYDLCRMPSNLVILLELIR